MKYLWANFSQLYFYEPRYYFFYDKHYNLSLKMNQWKILYDDELEDEWLKKKKDFNILPESANVSCLTEIWWLWYVFLSYL